MDNCFFPGDHPLRSAKWIWPEWYMYLHNHYAHFRRDFELNDVPEKAPFFITADKAYRLWVNGTYVCRGPARGYVPHWPFDEVDLSPYIKKGHNWISVVAYNPGISTFQYIHHTMAGLLCAARWPGFELISNTDWQMRRSPAHAVNTARYSLQIDFQEHVDCSKMDNAWIFSPEKPSVFEQNTPIGSFYRSAEFSAPPHDTVEPRGIPLMREQIVTPGLVAMHASGKCQDGYETCENASWQWVNESKEIKEWKPGKNVEASVKGDALEFTLEPAGKGMYHAAVIDFGEYVVGNAVVEVEGAAGGEILDFQHCEGFIKGLPATTGVGAGCMVALANRMRLAKGRNEHEFFHHITCRLITVIGRDITKPLKIRLRVRSVGYPFTMRGNFECSDTTLNDIFAICKRTQQICSFDAYVDTPWREQAQWWGDSRVQARNTFYMDGDARLLARGIRSIGDQPGPGGLTYGHAPTSAYTCVLPDFSLTWILTLWDHYWQTGETRLFKDTWPRVQQVLAYFESPEALHECGLLRHDRRLWLFEDWADLYKGEVPTFLNLWYIYTLKRLAHLLAICKMGRQAETWHERALELEDLATLKLFDPKTSLFIYGLDEKEQPVSKSSVHDQVLALMLNIVPRANDTMISRRVLPYLRDEKPDAAVPSAFWATYALEEMGRRGHAAEAIAFIRRHWEPMLPTGTTWEGFEWNENGGSASHAWTSHPSYHFVNILAGITQTAAAWSGVNLSPCFIKGIDHVKALVPSPKGDITAEWTRSSKAIKVCMALPKKVTANIDMPGVKDKCVGPGKFSWDVPASLVK